MVQVATSIKRSKCKTQFHMACKERQFDVVEYLDNCVVLNLMSL